MEIKKPKIGEYIRTKDGEIFKLAKYYKLGRFKQMKDSMGILHGRYDKVVKKHSFDIRDLFEFGDFVNGERLQKAGDMLGLTNDQCGVFYGIKRIQVISFVTKEQFEDKEKWNQRITDKVKIFYL